MRSMSCWWKLVENSSRPSFPPVPRIGGKKVSSSARTIEASIQGSSSSGHWFLSSRTTAALSVTPASVIHPALRALLITFSATSIAARRSARRAVEFARMLSSLRSGSLSLLPKPLPPFQGLSTGMGLYSSASH